MITLTNEERAAILKFFAGVKGLQLNELSKAIGLTDEHFSDRLSNWRWTASELYRLQDQLELDLNEFNLLFTVTN